MDKAMNVKIFTSHAKIDCLFDTGFTRNVNNGQRQRRIKVVPTFSRQRASILSSSHWIECFGL